MAWDPLQYQRFTAQREMPFADLLALVQPAGIARICDLGCGTGQLTARLQQHFGAAEVLGIDSSAEMLAQAYPLAHAQLRFEQADLRECGSGWDLIFSHAALQWLPDHRALLAQLWQSLAPGGQLAIQMPSNHRHISHRLIHQLASLEPFASALSGWQRDIPVEDIETYAGWLFALQAEQITVQEKVYPHILDSALDVLEWVKGTALRPYLTRLPPDLQAGFLAAYRAEIVKALPETPVFYGFRRILMYARKRC